jgi:hypothetical protein
VRANNELEGTMTSSKQDFGEQNEKAQIENEELKIKL